MKRPTSPVLISMMLITDLAQAGDSTSRAMNWNAIGMFLLFVTLTLGITRWAALRTRTPAISSRLAGA